MEATAGNKKLAQNDKETPLSFNAKVAVIGFYGGLIWGIIGYLIYLLNFTKYGPALFLNPWALGDWKSKTLGQFISIVLIALLSILVAYGYRFTLAKFKNVWVAIGYGIVLWLIVFYVLNPIFPDLEPITELDKNTLVTTLCLYILYGLFIGFSVSFEYHEFQQSKKEAAK